MRINPPIAVLSIIAAAMAALAWSHCTTERRYEMARCDVAQDYAEYVLSNPGSISPFFMMDSYSPTENVDDFLKTPEGRKLRNDPLVPLLKQQFRLRERNPIKDCSTVRDLLTSRKIHFGFVADDQFYGPYRYEYISMSMPAVDLVKGIAILDGARVAGPLDGEGFTVIMHREKGGFWRVQSSSPTWIS